MTNRLLTWGPGLVFLAAMLWATDAPFRTHLTENLSSSFIVFAEHGIDMLFALPLLVLGWAELKKLSWKEWCAVLTIGIGGSALAGVAFTQSFHYVNPSVAIVLQKIQPLIAIALAYVLLGEKLHQRFWLWAAVALGSAYLISFPNLVPQLYAGEAFNPNVIGASLAIFAAGLWAVSTVLGKFALRTLSFQTLTALRFLFGFLFLGVLNVTQHTFPTWSNVSSTDWIFIVIIALASGVFSLFLYYYGLRYTKASIATIAELGFPFAAVFVNAYFIPGNASAGTFAGLHIGQWIGTIMLLVAMYMLSRVNERESSA